MCRRENFAAPPGIEPIQAEEHKLRVFDNRVLRRKFRPKRKDVVGCWRRLHDEKLQNLYTSPNIMKVIK
jgi:hypothetical protein